MYMTSLRFSVVLLASGVLLAGCEPARQAPWNTVASVSFEIVKPVSLTLETELAGRTSAFQVAEVRPQVSGIVQKRLFTEGADVKAGDTLYLIDPEQYLAAHDNARATLRNAQANARSARRLAERYSEIIKLDAVSRQEHDNAQAAHEQAQAQIAAAQAALRTAEINLRHTRVTAPISGRIGRSSVTEGALVTQHQTEALATIQRLDRMYVDLSQSSSDWLRLKAALDNGVLQTSGEKGLQVRLSLENGQTYTQRVSAADERKPVIGELLFSDVTVAQGTGAITVRAVFPNTEGLLLPGMYVRATLLEGVRKDVVLIPQKAMTRDNRSRPVAMVLVEPKETKEKNSAGDMYAVERRVLEVERQIGHRWLVTSGLQAGDRLLVEGVMKVRPKQPVKGVPVEIDAAANS
jgi:membrane fusion protein (multidrug efflux system)